MTVSRRRSAGRGALGVCVQVERLLVLAGVVGFDRFSHQRGRRDSLGVQRVDRVARFCALAGADVAERGRVFGPGRRVAVRRGRCGVYPFGLRERQALADELAALQVGERKADDLRIIAFKINILFTSFLRSLGSSSL